MEISVPKQALLKLARLRAAAVQAERVYSDALDTIVLSIHGEPVDITTLVIDWDNGVIRQNTEEK